MQKLGTTSEPARLKGDHGGCCRGNQQAPLPKARHRCGPEQAGNGHPRQGAAGSKALGQEQRGGHDHRQWANGRAEPDLAGLGDQQQPQGQQSMGRFEARALAAHHEQENPAGGEGFCKPDQPDS